MGTQCLDETWFKIIGVSKFPDCFLNDGSYFPIVDMTDIWKQVMLNLKV